jgi:hypothetical protein
MELENAYVDYISTSPSGNVSKLNRIMYYSAEKDLAEFVNSLCDCKYLKCIKNINIEYNLYIQKLFRVIHVEIERRHNLHLLKNKNLSINAKEFIPNKENYDINTTKIWKDLGKNYKN